VARGRECAVSSGKRELGRGGDPSPTLIKDCFRERVEESAVAGRGEDGTLGRDEDEVGAFSVLVVLNKGVLCELARSE
jgi:hypothetical protein